MNGAMGSIQTMVALLRRTAPAKHTVTPQHSWKLTNPALDQDSLPAIAAVMAMPAPAAPAYAMSTTQSTLPTRRLRSADSSGTAARTIQAIGDPAVKKDTANRS